MLPGPGVRWKRDNFIVGASDDIRMSVEVGGDKRIPDISCKGIIGGRNDGTEVIIEDAVILGTDVPGVWIEDQGDG